MKKKLLLLTSVNTGHGHKSISDSLEEQFAQMPDIEVKTIDAFELIGRTGVRLSKMYGPMTRKATDLWEITYKLADHYDEVLVDLLSQLIHTRFMKLIKQFHPDAIMTVHSMFNGSVLNLLSVYGLNIPFITLQADIININRTWCDPRATLTLCPTREAYEASLRQNMPPDRLECVHFPVRERFCRAAIESEKRIYDGNGPFRCLIMSGGEGSGDLMQLARSALECFDCRVDVVCGRNDKLRQALQDSLGVEFGDRITALGFVDDVQKHMIGSDIVIARGSPNTMMEAVTCATPLVITGSLPGQEADNPLLMEKHGIGVLCNSPDMLPAVIGDLMFDSAAKWKQMHRAQCDYRSLTGAKEIAERVLRLVENRDYAVPKRKLNISLAIRRKNK